MGSYGNLFLLLIFFQAQRVSHRYSSCRGGQGVAAPRCHQDDPGTFYLLFLTPDERKAMLRMADKTVSSVQKTSEYAINNPAFVPALVDLAELQ